MGHIVNEGKKTSFAPKAYESRQAPRNGTAKRIGWHQKLYYADTGGVRMRISAYGDNACGKIENDLALVREHFGTNISDSLRISLHLMAKAIRSNKALPEVK